jgi:hypothetical protein
VRLSGGARPVLFDGRLISLVGAALATGLMTWRVYELLRYAFLSEHPTWDEVGLLPFVIGLRIIVAAWVGWSTIRLWGDTLVRVLLTAFGVSFILLYGWYFLLIGMDDGFLYRAVAGDFLYLAGALAVGCALLLEKIGPRPAANQARAPRGSKLGNPVWRQRFRIEAQARAWRLGGTHATVGDDLRLFEVGVQGEGVLLEVDGVR